MKYNFLANREDKIRIFDFIFTNTDLQIFDSYSNYSQKVCRYRNIDSIASKFDLENGGQFALTFQLWSPRFGKEIQFRKIELNPHYCNGHTYRYATNGLGLIQLYLGGCQGNCLFHSHIGHFNEKGALSRAEDEVEKEKVRWWNWKEITLTSGQLKRGIRKTSVDKRDGMDVLLGVKALAESGVSLQY
jgi:hypothetical protein